MEQIRKITAFELFKVAEHNFDVFIAFKFLCLVCFIYGFTNVSNVFFFAFYNTVVVCNLTVLLYVLKVFWYICSFSVFVEAQAYVGFSQNYNELQVATEGWYFECKW